jgi:cytochrome c oxidase subunit 1
VSRSSLHAQPSEPPLPEDARQTARRLTLRYLLASTAIFLASGLLGLLLHNSQADLGRLDDNTWYAVMTAHGLGAFVGWAGFAVMGLSWWVLAWVGFPIRRLGRAMAEAAFWLMVLGVAGVLVTTLAMDFAGSWVFLYPISFHAAGRWSDAAAGLFSGSVLLVGLAIVAWCLGILHTVLGPALHAVSRSLPTRLGVALGFGYVAPRRFATNPRPVPYPVIPLAVIGLGMIVATLPLAALLVQNVVQAIDNDVDVDPLLAKNVLWWFGHPVVYLLLFPAAAVYYLLIPRYAGRPLVAGNVVAIAWAIALVANVLVWAHHIYLDYPEGSVQAALNLSMQPMTFALTLPSALSLYSLAFTVWRSDFRWTGASTALFLGLVGWLAAGLSGVVNATIAFDQVVHNTLWVVGHFHHMALLNIGLAVIGGIYAFLPELTGKRLYSDALAKWHVWLTFIAGTAFFAVWLVQGLEGAPRRFSVLPERFDTGTLVAVPFTFLLAGAQLLFVWNVVQTLRGAAPPERRPLSAYDREAVLMLAVLAFAALMFVAGVLVGRATKKTAGAPQPRATQPQSLVAQGKEVFAKAGCGSCHTLSAAAAKGAVGPNLDRTLLGEAAIARVVRSGRPAKGMPAFGQTLSGEDIEAVAAFVARSRR